MAEPTTPVDEALTQLARSRRDRWIVVIVLVIAVVTGAVLILRGGADGRLTVWAIGAFALVALGFGISVADQERREQRAVAALLAERELEAALEARIASLETVHAAVRELTAADELTEVFDLLLTGALEVTGAHSGAVLLRVGDDLTVASSGGPDAPVRGTSLPVGEGVVGAAVTDGEALLGGRGAPWGSATGSSTVAAPLRLPDRIVGALVVVRGPADPAFTGADATAAALFAEHAALAVRNASRLDEKSEALAVLADAAVARGVDVAGIVHDLKSPLAAVSGFVQLMLERDERFTPARRRTVMLDVDREVRRLREMIDGLVQAAMAEADAVRLDDVVDLTTVARDVARTGRGIAHDQGRPRQIVVTATPPVLVLGDQAALRRVVTNLLDNAIAYSPPGSPVELSATAAGGRARLTVRDHGRGLDPAEREHLFEPYRPGEGGRSGLGLFVAQTLVGAHGGGLRLVPADGGGTVAEVSLPSAAEGTQDGA